MPVQNFQKKGKNEVYSSIREHPAVSDAGMKRTRRVKLARRDTLRQERGVVYSHIYNKGVEKRNLFNDEADYKVFLGYLKDYLTTPADTESIKQTFKVNGRIFQGIPHQPKNYFNKVELIAYSLLPDHFHLLVHQITKGALENLIRSLCTRYAIYYNKKYQRSGSLFMGPYKSVQIKDVSQLLHLTRYFHREPFEEKGVVKDLNHNGYSSYEEYLGVKETSWIKPKVVLSYFYKSENDYFKGKTGYKNFVESYVLKHNEKKMLERIIIDSKPEQLERTDLKLEESESFQEVHTEPVLKPRSRIPEFIATSTLAFVLLLALGIRNINISQAQTKKTLTSLPSPTPQVAAAEDTQAKPKMLIIKITDGAESVNIRKDATTKSDKVGTAKDGDTFELVSKEGNWYQIKLDDGSIAFVSERYAEMKGGDNN